MIFNYFLGQILAWQCVLGIACLICKYPITALSRQKKKKAGNRQLWMRGNGCVMLSGLTNTKVDFVIVFFKPSQIMFICIGQYCMQCLNIWDVSQCQWVQDCNIEGDGNVWLPWKRKCIIPRTVISYQYMLVSGVSECMMVVFVKIVCMVGKQKNKTKSQLLFLHDCVFVYLWMVVWCYLPLPTLTLTLLLSSSSLASQIKFVCIALYRMPYLERHFLSSHYQGCNRSCGWGTR